MEEFKDVLTDDEKQRRMLLHCVEDTRKLHPDFRKSTLAKTIGGHKSVNPLITKLTFSRTR